MRDQCAAGEYETKPAAVKNCRNLRQIHEARIVQPGMDVMKAVRQYLDMKYMFAEIAAHLLDHPLIGCEIMLNAVKGPAAKIIGTIGRNEDAYHRAWLRLCSHYENVEDNLQKAYLPCAGHGTMIRQSVTNLRMVAACVNDNIELCRSMGLNESPYSAKNEFIFCFVVVFFSELNCLVRIH